MEVEDDGAPEDEKVGGAEEMTSNAGNNGASGHGAGSGTLEGTLSKWTNVMKGWQYRFFVLDENAGLLSYYTVSVPIGIALLTSHIAPRPRVLSYQV